MANCIPSTLSIPRPSKGCGGSGAMTSCGGGGLAGCGDLGPVDPLDKDCLTPRPRRELVRGQMRDSMLLMLGAPVVKVELDEQQVDFIIDYVLKIIENYAPRDYFDYYTFNTVPGQSVYEMPCDIGYVRNVFWKQHPTFAFQSSDLQGAIPIEYFYPGGAYSSIQGGLIDPIQPIWGRMGEWTLYKMYEMMYSRVSSNIGGWEWVSDFKHIKLYPIPHRPQAVIVHYIQRNKDWPEVTEAMIEGSNALSKVILGRIRSKFVSPPGPGGGLTLDGQALLAEGLEEFKQWKENLIYRFGDIMHITWG